MSIRSSIKRNATVGHVVEGVPQAVANGAEEAANRLAGAAQTTGTRVAQRASRRASDLGGQLGNRASDVGSRANNLGGQIGSRASDLGAQVGDRVASTNADLGRSKTTLGKQLSGLGGGLRVKLRRSPDVMLKAQLAKTSRELAHESSDLGQAVGSLNSVIKANRKAAAKGRTRLIAGVVIGAAVTYHLDAEHGRERRAATARRASAVVRGKKTSGV